jgi:hypothetical protein
LPQEHYSGFAPAKDLLIIFRALNITGFEKVFHRAAKDQFSAGLLPDTG